MIASWSNRRPRPRPVTRALIASRSPRLPVAAPEHLQQLGDLPALLVRIARPNGVLDAMADVVLEHLLLDAPQAARTAATCVSTSMQ